MLRPTSAMLLVCVALAAGCRSRTYVLATVEVDRSVTGAIAELQFTSSLLVNGAVESTDEERYTADGPLTFPRSFVLLADDRQSGDVIDIFVEAHDAAGGTVARGHARATLVADEETTIQVVLRPGCSTQDDCLGGQPFCENPQVCTCVGGDCARGYCERIDLDDGNSCTETICNEAERTATHEVLADGTACTNTAGETHQCSQGICKAPVCGDFIIDPGEECDDGMLLNSDTTPNACRESCRLPSCGDGVIDQGIAFGRVFDEQCDEGAGNVVIEDGEMVISPGIEPDEHCRQSVTLASGSGETLHCVLPFCGDGRLNGTERCDDHNLGDGDGSLDGCNPTCTLFGEVTTIAGSPGGPGHHDGVGAEARLEDVFDFAVGDGVAYFTSQGDFDDIIRRVSLSTGEVTTIAGLESGRVDGPGGEARFANPRGLAVAGSSLYIADSGNHSIRRLDLATGVVDTVAGSGNAGSVDGDLTSAQFNRPTFIVARSATELLVYDDATCKLRAIDLTAQQVTTIAGQSCLPFGNNFFNVNGMAIGPEPSLFVTDEQAIRQVNLTDGTVTTVAGSLSAAGLVDGAALDARFSQPARLAFDGTRLFVADLGNDVIRTLDLSAGQVATITPSPAIDQPQALGLDGPTLILGDRVNHVVWTGVVDGSSGISLSPLAGIVSPVAEELLASPLGITMMPGFSSSLYVASGPLIHRVALDSGEVTVLFDLSGSATDVFDLVAAGDRLFASALAGIDTNVVDLTLSAEDTVSSSASTTVLSSTAYAGLAIVDGYLYVTDKTSQQVVRAPLSDLTDVDNFAGSSAGGAEAVIDGTLEQARFLAPTGVVACGGLLYLSETELAIGSHVVRQIDPAAGRVTTIAGFPTASGYQDAVASQTSLFDNPVALACDDRDPLRPILYVADQGNHVIRQIDLATEPTTGERYVVRVSTVAGLPGNAVSLDGRGSTAAFSSPRALYFDPVSGDLFVADLGEGVIRRVH